MATHSSRKIPSRAERHAARPSGRASARASGRVRGAPAQEDGALERRLSRLEARLARARRRLPAELSPSELLYELIRASGLRRGLLGLLDAEGGLRVDYQRGLRPRDQRDLSAWTSCMRAALRARAPKVQLGSALSNPSPLEAFGGRFTGAVLALPLVHGGALIGVVALEDPARSLPPRPERVELLGGHASELAPALARGLRRRAPGRRAGGARQAG